MNLEKVFIVGGVRTPIGSFLGSLSNLDANDLGAIVIEELLKRTQINKEEIDEVIMGNVIQAGNGQNVARQSAIKAGLGYHIPSFTVNKVCGSGLKSVILAAQSIMIKDNRVVIAGGTESMTNAPFLVRGIRKGIKMGNFELIDSMIWDGLWDKFDSCHMGATAENIADKYQITKKEQDEFAYQSQQKYAKAFKENKFLEEIVPIKIIQNKDEVTFSNDEHPRVNTTIETLSKLKPVFKNNGTVTAGNASGINDGAAAVLVVSEQYLSKISVNLKFEVISFASTALDPSVMGLGPITAIKKALSKVNLKIEDIDLFEINEAFAVQSLQVIRELNIPKEKVNVNGGAIALGHPIGASGTRILVTLMYEMKRRKSKYGVASLCIGGGQGIAIVIRNVF